MFAAYLERRYVCVQCAGRRMVDEWEIVQCGSPANGAMKMSSVEGQAITGENFCYDSLVGVKDMHTIIDMRPSRSNQTKIIPRHLVTLERRALWKGEIADYRANTVGANQN